MYRLPSIPRSGWQKKVEEQGLIYHTANDGKTPYWNENAFYLFSRPEIDALEAATNDLYEMCISAAQHVIDHNRFADFGIPSAWIPAITQAWNNEPPSLYGRFDFAFDGKNIKLLEFNADTPTALVEAAIIQYYWMKDVRPGDDQFNSLHEKLIAKWQDLKPYISEPLTFACVKDNYEDEMTIAYLAETAHQAGIAFNNLNIEDIGWDRQRKIFVNLNEEQIHTLFKLYPWEWLINEEFGPHILESTVKEMLWIEPVWKMLWSNKAILAVLWELYPNHPLLLETYLDDPRGMKSYVKKPKLSREGSNVTVVLDGVVQPETDGDYGEEGFVYQKFVTIPSFDGNFPIIGSWYVADQGAAGMGIRESTTLITGNLSQFVPHVFN